MKEDVNHLEGGRAEVVGKFDFPALYSLWGLGIKGIYWGGVGWAGLVGFIKLEAEVS